MKRCLLIMTWFNLFLFFVRFAVRMLSLLGLPPSHTFSSLPPGHSSPARDFQSLFSLSEEESGYFSANNGYSISVLANKTKPFNGLFFQRSQQVCHCLKSIMSPEQETPSTEFQKRQVCHKHSTITMPSQV